MMMRDLAEDKFMTKRPDNLRREMRIILIRLVETGFSLNDELVSFNIRVTS